MRQRLNTDKGRQELLVEEEPVKNQEDHDIWTSVREDHFKQQTVGEVGEL